MTQIPTFAEVLELLPALALITERTADEVELLFEAQEDPDSLAHAVDASLERWQQAVALLGGLVSGLWTVEFPAPGGCWLWSLSEPELLRRQELGAPAAPLH